MRCVMVSVWSGVLVDFDSQEPSKKNGNESQPLLLFKLQIRHSKQREEEHVEVAEEANSTYADGEDLQLVLALDVAFAC